MYPVTALKTYKHKSYFPFDLHYRLFNQLQVGYVYSLHNPIPLLDFLPMIGIIGVILHALYPGCIVRSDIITSV